MKSTKRTARVFISLVAVMTFTSALLLAISPEPLTPDAARAVPALMADEVGRAAPPPAGGVLETYEPVRLGRWTSIRLRHSRAAPDMGIRLPGDHFVVFLAEDGSARVHLTDRWDRQLPALGAEDGVVSVVFAGDFDRAVPSQGQLARGLALVRHLQRELRIGSEGVLISQSLGSSLSIGEHFPVRAFRQGLFP